MTSFSATSVNLGFSFNQANLIKKSHILQASSRISLGSPSLRSSLLRNRLSCSAKPETVEKVIEMVKKQLALDESIAVTPESTMTQLGADSLDTVEIMMGLEEVYNVDVQNVEQDKIVTLLDAANLIDTLVEESLAKPADEEPSAEPDSQAA